MQVVKSTESDFREYRVANFGDVIPDLDLKQQVKIHRELEYTPEEERKIAKLLEVQTNTKGKRVYKMKHSEIEHSEIVEKRIQKLRSDSSWRLVGDSNSKNTSGQQTQKLFQGKRQNFATNSCYYLAIPKNGVIEIHKIHDWYSFSPLPLHQNLQSTDIIGDKQHIKSFSERLEQKISSTKTNNSFDAPLQFDSISSFVNLERDTKDSDAIHQPTSDTSTIFTTGGSLLRGNLGIENQDADVELFSGDFADDEDETTIETTEYRDSTSDLPPQSEDSEDQSVLEFDQEKDPFAEDEEFEIDQWEKKRESENLNTFSELKSNNDNKPTDNNLDLDDLDALQIAETRLVDDWKSSILQHRETSTQSKTQKSNQQAEVESQKIRSALLSLLLSQDEPISLPDLLERFQLVKSHWRKLPANNSNKKKWDYFRKILKTLATKTKPGKQILFQIKPIYKTASSSSRSKRGRE